VAAFSRLGSGRYGVRRTGIFSRAQVQGTGEARGSSVAVAEFSTLIITGTGVSVGQGAALGADVTSTRGALQRFSRLSTGRWGMRKAGLFTGRGTITYISEAGTSVGIGYAAAVIDPLTPRSIGHFSKLATGRWGMRLPGNFTGRGGNVTVEQTGVSVGHSVVMGDLFTGSRTIPKRTRLLVSGWGSRLTGTLARGLPTYVAGVGSVSAGGVAVATGLLQSNINQTGTIGAKGKAGVAGTLQVFGAAFNLGNVSVGAKGKAGVAGTLTAGVSFSLGSVSVGGKAKAGVAASTFTANNPFDLGVVSVGARGKASVAGETQPQAVFELGVVALGARGRAAVAGRFFGEPWVPVATAQSPNWSPVVKG